MYCLCYTHSVNNVYIDKTNKNVYRNMCITPHTLTPVELLSYSAVAEYFMLCGQYLDLSQVLSSPHWLEPAALTNHGREVEG